MKKTLCALLAALTLIACAFADTDAFYRETACELAAEVDEIALCGMLEQLLGLPENTATLLEGYGGEGCHEPDALWLIDFDPAETLRSMLAAYSPELAASLNETQMAIAERLFSANSLVTQQAAKGGSQALSASSVCRASRCYLEPEGMPKAAIVLLVKEGAQVCAACVYSHSGEGICTAEAMYLPLTGSAREVVDGICGITGIEAREIER